MWKQQIKYKFHISMIHTKFSISLAQSFVILRCHVIVLTQKCQMKLDYHWISNYIGTRTLSNKKYVKEFCYMRKIASCVSHLEKMGICLCCVCKKKFHRIGWSPVNQFFVCDKICQRRILCCSDKRCIATMVAAAKDLCAQHY